MYSSLKLCPQESKAMSKLFTLLRLLVPKITGSAYDYHPSLWIPFAVLANAFLRAVDAEQFCRDFCPSISLASAQALLLSPGGSVSGLWFPDLLFSREIPRTNKSEDPIRSLSEARAAWRRHVCSSLTCRELRYCKEWDNNRFKNDNLCEWKRKSLWSHCCRKKKIKSKCGKSTRSLLSKSANRAEQEETSAETLTKKPMMQTEDVVMAEASGQAEKLKRPIDIADG